MNLSTTLESMKKNNDPFLLVREKSEWIYQFKIEAEEFKTAETEYKMEFIFRSIISITRIDGHWYSWVSDEMFKEVNEFIAEHSLDNCEHLLELVPELFNCCNFTGSFDLMHSLLEKNLSSQEYLQRYLLIAEPLIFSWENWYDVLKNLKPHDAEKAMINLFKESGLERFQGNLVETEWQVEFLACLLDLCDKNNLVDAKKVCLKELADLALRHPSEICQLINNKELKGLDSEIFESTYIENANDYLDHLDSYEHPNDININLLHNFTESERLKSLINKRNSMIADDLLEDSKALVKERDYQGLVELFNQDYMDIVKDNVELMNIFNIIPNLVLDGLNEKEADKYISPELLVGLKRHREWSYVTNQILEKIKPDSKFSYILFTLETLFREGNKDCLVIAKKLAKEGFEGMNDFDKSKFLSIFDNEDYESLFGNAYINIDGHYHDEWIDWSGFEE